MATPKLHIPGRHRIETGGIVSWAWPGVYAEFPFMGPGFVVQAEGEGACVRISVDGRSQEFGPLGIGRQSLLWDFESRAYSAVHVARIQVTSQEGDKIFRIHDISPRGPSSLLEREMPKPALHIEFVGDSWTSGYGNLSATEQRSDCTQAFAALTAENLKADYSLVAASGHGLVKSFGETPPSRNNLVAKYPRAFPSIPAVSSWGGRIANFAVILAGENDYSSSPYPTDRQFIEAYRKLIALVRYRHAGVQIVMVSVQRPHDAPRLAAEVYRVECETSQDIHFLPIADLDTNQPLGFNSHPGLEHHKQIAQALTAFISGLK